MQLCCFMCRGVILMGITHIFIRFLSCLDYKYGLLVLQEVHCEAMSGNCGVNQKESMCV